MPLLQLAEVLEKTAALQAADASGRILAHQFSKVSEYHHGERYPEDDSGKEPARRDLADIMVHKWQDHIPGGLAEGKKPSDFPAEDLVLGMTVEMEHTSDPSIACEIAMDHLVEKSDYYRKGDMAKEVEESLGKVEDGAITLAKQAGILVARMSKEAWNPLGAAKKLITPAMGSLAKPIESATVRGVVGGAEHAVGKVLPMAHPGHIPTATGGFAQAKTVMHAPAAGAGSGNALVDRVNAIQQQAANQGNFHGAIGQAKAQARAQVPGAPTRVVNIPEGNLGTGERRLGADEWIASHPDEALKNRLLSAKQNSVKTAPGFAAPGQLQSPAAGTRAGGSVGGSLDLMQAEVARAHPTPYTDRGAAHLLETGKAAPAATQGWVEKANRDIAAAQPATAAQGSVASPAATTAQGSVVSPATAVQGSVAAPRASVKRVGVGKALAVGALGAGAYGAYKAAPWAARQVEQTSGMPLAYGGGWSPTPYGYGNTPYGSGVQTMGPGA
jgi:hypothetical protein